MSRTDQLGGSCRCGARCRTSIRTSRRILEVLAKDQTPTYHICDISLQGMKPWIDSGTQKQSTMSMTRNRRTHLCTCFSAASCAKLEQESKHLILKNLECPFHPWRSVVGGLSEFAVSAVFSDAATWGSRWHRLPPRGLLMVITGFASVSTSRPPGQTSPQF